MATGVLFVLGLVANVDSVQEPSKDVVEFRANKLGVLLGRKAVIEDHIAALIAGGTFKDNLQDASVEGELPYNNKIYTPSDAHVVATTTTTPGQAGFVPDPWSQGES